MSSKCELEPVFQLVVEVELEPGIGVGRVVTWRVFTTGSDSSDVGVVSTSRFSNEVLKAMVAICMPSGNGSD